MPEWNPTPQIRNRQDSPVRIREFGFASDAFSLREPFMSLPVLPLPVLQNWDCHSCGNCCREYDVAVTEEERKRIESQGWGADPEIGRRPLVVRSGPWWSRSFRLSHRGDNGCIFLTADNRCRIHERFGADSKPLACRLFPFLL